MPIEIPAYGFQRKRHHGDTQTASLVKSPSICASTTNTRLPFSTSIEGPLLCRQGSTLRNTLCMSLPPPNLPCRVSSTFLEHGASYCNCSASILAAPGLKFVPVESKQGDSPNAPTKHATYRNLKGYLRVVNSTFCTACTGLLTLVRGSHSYLGLPM